MVRLHGLPLGPRSCELRAGGRGDGHGDLRHVGPALRAARYYSWIIDRFHLSTRLYQRLHHRREYDFRWLEERLLPLGFHLVLCTRRPETFEHARRERLKISGNPGQYDNLGVFVEEQEELRRLASESALPVLELDISDNDVPRAAEQIAGWMGHTGGLWSPV